ALVDDTDDSIASTEEGAVRDAALIDAVRKIKHSEIAAYGTLRILAKQLGYTKVRYRLKQSLDEEQADDDKLHELLQQKSKPGEDYPVLYFARILFFWILPDPVRGSCSTNHTSRGRWDEFRCSRAYCVIESRSSACSVSDAGTP